MWNVKKLRVSKGTYYFDFVRTLYSGTVKGDITRDHFQTRNPNSLTAMDMRLKPFSILPLL